MLIFPLIENFIVGKVEDIRGQPVSPIEVFDTFDYWKGVVLAELVPMIRETINFQ